jgi:SMC interacting uncharacterized protein involved in chromosome segregation
MDTESRLEKLNDALSQVVVQIKVMEMDLEALKEQEAFIRGQVAEREFDQEEEVQLPVYETEEELQKALDNRGKGFFGEDPKEVLGQRQDVVEREAMKKMDYINEAADESA